MSGVEQDLNPIELATQLPPTWFNSIRNEENRLDSSPVPLQFRLAKPLADKVEAEVQALVRQQSVSANDAILRVMQSCMKVDVVYYDGQPVTIFCPDSAVHETLVPAPQIVSAEFVHTQRSLTVYVTRKLPLSSAHANRFFRLGFLWMGHGVEHVLFTRAISVLAKQAPGAERKQKYFASHKAEPSRTCWILQRAASSRGMDLSKSFDSACAPAPMGVGGYKRARGAEPPARSSASFARVAAVPPRHTPHQAPVIASQPAAIQAVPTPPASAGEFPGLTSGLADMARQDSLERGHSLVGGDEHGSHSGLPFADLLAMAPSQDASVPDLARSFSARSSMSVGSGFNFGGQ